MKLEQKIFIQSFLLIIIAFCILGYLMIYNNHINNLEFEIDNNISEHNRLLETISTNCDELAQQKNSSFDFRYNYISKTDLIQLQDVADLVKNAIESNQKNSISTKIYLYSSGNLLCGNDTFLSQDTLNAIYPYGENLYSRILDLPSGKELFITSYFTINDIEYLLITKQNIDPIYELKDKNTNFFIKIALLFSTLGAVILRFSIHSITKKLGQIQDDMEKIETVKDANITIFEGHDEISNLSKSLENMTNHLKENLQQIENKANSNELFINTLAHEMRNPTSILSSLSETLLTDSSLTEEQKAGCIERIYKSANYIDKIKESLMELLSINSKSIQKKYVNISDIALDVCHSLKKIEKYKKLNIVTNIQKNVILYTNEDLMRILFRNFLTNSAEASNPDGRIEVYVTKKYFKIVDYGSGIPENQLEQIRKPFITVGKENGIGLGLNLCEKIADIHHTHFDIKNNKKHSGVTVLYYF